VGQAAAETAVAARRVANRVLITPLFYRDYEIRFSSGIARPC
jgi:hypothetical protein